MPPSIISAQVISTPCGTAQRAVALVAAQVGQRGAERLAPGDGAAVVAGMAEDGASAHLGQQFAHQPPVAAEAVAGQQHGTAAHVLLRAVGTQVADAAARGAWSSHHSSARARGAHQVRAGVGAAACRRAISAAPVRCGSACMRVRRCGPDRESRRAARTQAVALPQRVERRCDRLRRRPAPGARAALPCALAWMSAAKRAALSSMPPAPRCTRVPAAGMKPEDSAVEPLGVASRSSSTQSMPGIAQRRAPRSARTRRRRRWPPALRRVPRRHAVAGAWRDARSAARPTSGVGRSR